MSYNNFFTKLFDHLKEDGVSQEKIDRPTETEDSLHDDFSSRREEELSQLPLSFVGEEEEISAKASEIEMFSYVASFMALKEEIKRQNRSQEKTSERLELLLEETKQVKQDYRQRLELFESEKEEASKTAVLSLIKSVLPALDGLDFAIKNARKNWGSIKNQPPPFWVNRSDFLRDRKVAKANLSGLIAVRERFYNWLSEVGVSPIDAEKATFDSRSMKALDAKIVPDAPHNTVIEEIRRGYQRDGFIIRPAEVVVSIKPDNG